MGEREREREKERERKRERESKELIKSHEAIKEKLKQHQIQKKFV